MKAIVRIGFPNARRCMAAALAGLAAAAGALPASVAADSPLVDVAWIVEHSCDADVVVLDVRRSHNGYLVGHIPCALYTNFYEDGWRAEVGGVPMMIPPLRTLEALIGGLGIGAGSHVVLYTAAESDLAAAETARVYTILRYAGIERISILDGGLTAYTADWRNDVETGERTPEPVPFEAAPASDMIVAKEDVRAAMDAGLPLVDVRTGDYYLGINQEPITARPGTIPGAVNLPLTWLTVDRGLVFRKPADLATLFAAASVPAAGAAIFFCNSGLESSLGWFVAHELMGNDAAVLYDGSLAEWSADPDLPMTVKVAVE